MIIRLRSRMKPYRGHRSNTIFSSRRQSPWSRRKPIRAHLRIRKFAWSSIWKARQRMIQVILWSSVLCIIAVDWWQSRSIQRTDFSIRIMTGSKRSVPSGSVSDITIKRMMSLTPIGYRKHVKQRYGMPQRRTMICSQQSWCIQRRKAYEKRKIFRMR